MHEIKRMTCSQKADPWGPVLPTSSPQRAVVALCGFSGGWRGEGRQECSHPAWGGVGVAGQGIGFLEMESKFHFPSSH